MTGYVTMAGLDLVVDDTAVQIIILSISLGDNIISPFTSRYGGKLNYLNLILSYVIG